MLFFLSVLFLLVSTIALCQACSPAVVPITNAIASDSSWIDTMNNRVDIMENQQGAPLSLYLRIIKRTAVAEACANAEDAGAPMDYSVALLSNAQVDIWQVNATGSYSDNITTTWLRGYQASNTTGQVTFNTIFPAWTTGNTTHINVRVRTYDDNGVVVQDDTTQLFFDDAISTSIYAAFASLYPAYGTRDIYNNNDTLFSDNLLMTVTGNDVDGYEASIDLMYPFTLVTDTSTNTTEDATTDAPTDAPTAITDATTTPPIDNSTTATPTDDIPTTTTDMPTEIPTQTPTTNSTTGATNNAPQWMVSSMIPILLIEMIVMVVA